MIKNLKIILSAFLIFFISNAFSQNEKINIDWAEPVEFNLEGKEKREVIYFEGAQYNFAESFLPFFYQKVKNSNSRFLDQVSLENRIYSPLSPKELELVSSFKDKIQNEVEIVVENSIIKKQNVPFIKIVPFRKSSSGQIEKLVSADIDYTYGVNTLRSSRNKTATFASSSVLANGEWFKIAVVKSAAYKLTYNYLSSLGMDLDNIDPRNFRIYGYGGGMLPNANSEDRPDDLVENPIIVSGEADGKFNRNDYVAFYGESQVKWFYDSNENRFRHRLNTYSDTTFYFITADLGPGRRINTVDNPTTQPTNFVNSYNDYLYHEIDNSNLIKSGQMWVGEVFDNTTPQSLSFSFPNIDLTKPASFEVSAVARAGVTSTFTITADNQPFQLAVGSTVLSRYEVGFGRVSRQSYTFNPNSNIVNLQLVYNKPQSVAKGWLNFVNVNVESRLRFIGNQLLFRNIESVGVNNVSEFTITHQRPIRVWEIIDNFSIEEKRLIPISGASSFVTSTDVLKEFIAFSSFDSTGIFNKGKVPNQNLHALGPADLIIISHPLFLNQATDLANHHRTRGLRVNVVTTKEVYNEFSSGSQDIIALRFFLKMFYDRAIDNEDLPNYVLLFGDASYDMKDRISGNTNFVLGYQSPNSLQPTNSYISDDFIALLDDTEGNWQLGSTNPDKLDLGVGRLPVKTVEEASSVVAKIKSYSSRSTLGDWRNEIVFVGDDEDGSVHMVQSNELTKILKQENESFNTNKIFLDAFTQQSSTLGQRYPEVNQRITNAVQNGSLILNYTGHGGETGWAGERILTINEINSWDKLNNMPLLVTATCEFSRFDDPFRTSAGELTLLNANGGAIGLLTTTRLVFSSPNYILNRSFYNELLNRNADGDFQTLGEILMDVKNQNSNSSNSRNFSLLGDPSLTLAIPYYNVVTTSINGKPISQIDTLRALSKVTMTGYVADLNGQKLNSFNGVIFPTVFDKETERSTLANDGGNPFRFNTRENRLFKGKATVANGDFTFSFIVPKDISYSFGEGKVTYYAEDGQIDGNGFSTNFIIGGSDSSAIVDDLGPGIDLYMNDENFVFGGITNSSPVLLAKLSDEQGINTVGNGIGHDIVAILDANTENAIILNDYYEADLDNYQSGVVNYPFSNLSEGKHTITLKAWDVANNSSERTIEFTVVEESEVKIENLVNYPNPFTTNTEFIFQHNQPGIPLDIKLEIFTVSGKLVKSFDQVIITDGFISREIRWDGRDDFGDKIGKGVYVYKLKVRSRNGSTAEKYEKLVIL